MDSDYAIGGKATFRSISNENHILGMKDGMQINDTNNATAITRSKYIYV